MGSQIAQISPFLKYPETHDVQFIPEARHPEHGESQGAHAAARVSKYSVAEHDIQFGATRWKEALQLVQVVAELEQFEQGGVHGWQELPFNQLPLWQDVQVVAAEQVRQEAWQKSQIVPSKNWFEAHWMHVVPARLYPPTQLVQAAPPAPVQVEHGASQARHELTTW